MKAKVLTELQACVGRKEPCSLVTDTVSGQQCLVTSANVSGVLALEPTVLTEVRRLMAADKSAVIGETSLFARVYAPEPRMVIVGAVHIAQSLVPIAQLAGFAPIVIDPRAAFLSSGTLAGAKAIEAWPDEGMVQVRPDARTAVVTLTHDPKLDDPALIAALRSPAFYIGALGSRKTHDKRLQRLRVEGFSDDVLERIQGPVGLNINAISPAEIAVSIVAQVIQVMRVDAK
jgi:xanthine dehydrogenase accessory factor